jgi:uncharacterized protein YcgL (UPF0745 family)
MKCYVYKGSRKDGAYLYLPVAEHLAQLPARLCQAMGPLSLVLEFELTPYRKLAAGETKLVLHDIMHTGYHLQLPELDPSLARWRQASCAAPSARH